MPALFAAAARRRCRYLWSSGGAHDLRRLPSRRAHHRELMKITVSAGALASALALAAKLSDDAVAKNIAALAACGLEADGTTLSVTGNVLNFALTLTLPAEGERDGALAVNAAALAALTTTFPSEVAVAIED